MNHPLWILLAMLHGLKQALSDWRRLMDGRFDAVRRYLVKCPGEIVGTIPSPDGALRLDVFKRGAGYEALPQEFCESAIEPLEGLTEDDVVSWRLDQEKFEKDLGRALGLVPLDLPTRAASRHSLLGTFGLSPARRRVYLGYAWDEHGGLDVCLAVSRECSDSCCVALPAFFPACDEYLRRLSCGYVVLQDAVAFNGSGMVARPEQLPAAVFPGLAGCSATKARERTESRRIRILRRNGRAGGRPPSDAAPRLEAAVKDVLARLRNNPYLKMKRACVLAVEKEALTIGWEALRKHVRQVQRRPISKKSFRVTN